MQTSAYNPFGSSPTTGTPTPNPVTQTQWTQSQGIGAFSDLYPSIMPQVQKYTGTPQQPNAQYSYEDKKNLWQQSGLPMSSFDLSMFNRDANGQMYIKRDAFLQENDRQNAIQNPQATPEQVQQYSQPTTTTTQPEGTTNAP